MVEQLQQNDVANSGGLVFEDEQHSSRTMQSLNMMRKNKHFCDVILHVSPIYYLLIAVGGLVTDTYDL